jgi:Zn-dependent peptidase ImmA (M78 family)
MRRNESRSFGSSACAPLPQDQKDKSMRRHQTDSLEDQVKGLLDEHGIDGPPIPVDKLARAMGAKIRFSPLDDELSGLVYIKDGVPIIGLNSLHHPNRQRFSLAHEIAHLHLHREQITSSVHVDKRFTQALRRDATSSAGTDKIEIEANQFAAALLMPKHILEKLLVDAPIDIEDEKPIEDLAKKFHVSTTTLQYRLRNLWDELPTKRRGRPKGR